MRPLIVLLVLVSTICLGQETQPTPKGDGATSPQDTTADGDPRTRAVFLTVEKGIVSEDLGILSPLFGKQVSMTIRGNESGYFSSAQALTILKNYFSSRKALQFSFTRLHETAAHPYATGRLDYTVRGNKESVQVYISLGRQDTGWVISQFNIY